MEMWQSGGRVLPDAAKQGDTSAAELLASWAWTKAIHVSVQWFHDF